MCIRDSFCLVFHGFLDAGNEQIIQILKRQIPRLDEEGKHTPVDQVGTITLGSILVGDVRPAAQYLLAGSCLLYTSIWHWIKTKTASSTTAVNCSEPGTVTDLRTWHGMMRTATAGSMRMIPSGQN